ncbi:MAG: helix-turn-helix domain-containing protein, partial [Bdellovibrionales bacterium]|nr:helix-turn-helix domain-containing protein [Bdellovibrionales bacterium]
MDQSIDAFLKSFSLSDREKSVFTRLIGAGSQPASAVARVCEMPRNTVRGILDNLVKCGLVIRTQRAKTQYYSVES